MNSRKIIKNELPGLYKSWITFVKHNEKKFEGDLFIFIYGPQRFYINVDFAKARAYEEIIDKLKDILLL